MSDEERVLEALYYEFRITPEDGDATPLSLAVIRLLLADDPEPPAMLETGMSAIPNPQHDDWEDRDILKREALGILFRMGVKLGA